MTDPQSSPCAAPDEKSLTIGDVSLDLTFDRGAFLGFGEVRTRAGIVLRSAARPMSFNIRSPDGVELLNWRLGAITPETGGAVEMLLHCDRRDGGPMEYMLHTVRPRLNTADWSRDTRPATGTQLRLRLWPVARTIGGRRFNGFAYQYLFDSPDIAIYKILDRSTWEIGGEARGNQIWMRGAEPAVFDVGSSVDHYSSEWYLPGIANPNIFQFKPLQTHLQGFTFTAAERGVLVTWTPVVSHIRTLIQKDRGCDQILHLHESCGDLSTSLPGAPMEVLFCEAASTADETELANCYGDVRELVCDHLHGQIGMRRERIGATGMIEEWCVPDMDLYTDQGLGALAEVGVRTVEIANHFQNNMNVHGVANMCCTIDLKVAESVGEARLKRFCDAARDHNISVRMWGNTALSTLSSVFLEQSSPHPNVTRRIDLLPEKNSTAYRVMRRRDALVRDPTGSIEADHYRPRFAVMNLRDAGVREYWLDAWRDAHDRIGIGGIFLDSSFNLSSDKHHWCQDVVADSAGGATADQAHLLIHSRPEVESRPAILSQYMAHLQLIVEMQQMGYSYCAEDHGVFGIHRAGWNLAANLKRLHLWQDSLQNFDTRALQAAGAEPDAVFFEALAYRVMWLIHWDPVAKRLTFNQSGSKSALDEPTDDHLRLIRLFDAVEPWMQRRRILDGGKAVAYVADDVMVIWSMQPTNVELPEGRHRVENLSTGESTVVQDTLTVAARTVSKVHLSRAAADPKAESRLRVFVNQPALTRFAGDQTTVRQ